MRTLASVILTAPVAIAVVSPAAASDGESALSASLGAGTFTRPGMEEDESIGPTGGGVLGVTYERGFSEALSWRVEAAGGLYAGGGTSWSAVAAGGLVYRFDVLRYVPYGLVEVGALAVGGGPVPERVLEPIVVIGGGLDVLQSRDASWGVEARLGSFAGDTTWVALSFRLTRRWGYF